MNLYIYSDESGVFDKVNNETFVFGWLVLLGKEQKQIEERKYRSVEKSLYLNNKKYRGAELKACTIHNKDKNKLFRSINQLEKGAVVIDQRRVLDQIFSSKKDKQRYLDYAYKIGVKRHLENLIRSNKIDPTEVKEIQFCIDEHTTATNGLYELQEGLRQEFKYGTYNWRWDKYFPPIFPNILDIKVNFCASDKKTLIRAADITANKVFYHTNKKTLNAIQEKVKIFHQP